MQHDLDRYDEAKEGNEQNQEQLPVVMGRALMEEVSRRNIAARLLGGVAIYLRCPSVHADPLARTYNDIDMAVSQRGQKALSEALAAQGFVGDRQFNALHGHKRQLFAKEGVELDVFVHQFQQCHTLDLEERMTSDPLTLSLADLLLTKLQVVQLTQKDMTDVLALLVDHAIDLTTITKITGQDWGWYTTVLDNLHKIAEGAPSFLSGEEVTRVQVHIDELRQAMQNTSKSLSWKMRAKIGRRVPWYVLPEEK